METLDSHSSLFVLDAFDQNPDVKKFWLVLLLLDVLKDIVLSAILLGESHLSNLLLQGVLWT